MNSKDIGTCILRNTNDRNTLFSLSLVCKSYNRSFNEMKNKLMKRYGIDLEEYELYRDYNLKLRKDKTRQKVSDNILRKKVEFFLDKAFDGTRKHTFHTYISTMMCKYPKSLNINKAYIRNKIEDTVIPTFKKGKILHVHNYKRSIRYHI